MKTSPRFVVVVGASAGGLNALYEFAGQLSEDIDAAVCIVLHLSSKGISTFLVNQLQQRTLLKCVLGANITGMGAKENRWRPSIDVLFRSAAAAYNSYTIGIILSGLMDDGTTGMLAIKRSGGICIVHDPEEAEFPDMPVSVLNTMEVDYCVRLAELGGILNEVTKQERTATIPCAAMAWARVVSLSTRHQQQISPARAV